MKKKIKDILFQLFLKTSPPLSTWIYDFTRKYIYKDPRAEFFQSIVNMSRIDGDTLEFGVYRGTSFAWLWKFLSSTHTPRLIGFDSFRGLPSSEGGIMVEGAYSDTDIMYVQRLMFNIGADTTRYELIQGLFQHTLNVHTKEDRGITTASIVHIDCDLYESTVLVLDWITDLCVPGTIIILDNWFSFRYTSDINQGERKAFNDWELRDQFEPLLAKHNVTQAFVMKAPSDFEALKIPRREVVIV